MNINTLVSAFRLGLLLTFAACTPSTNLEPQVPFGNAKHSAASTAQEDHGVELHIRVIKYGARSDNEPPFALEVTLANEGAETLWLEHVLSTAGSLQVAVRGEDGSLAPSTCLKHPAFGEWHYMLLAPGEAIRRIVTLHCLSLPKREALTIRARYFNRSTSAAPPPWPGLLLFRGPLLSNEEKFNWNEAESVSDKRTYNGDQVGENSSNDNWTPEEIE